jgi:two-component system response regulator FlrC
MDELVEYGWPGNVRELDNVISRAVVFNDSGIIDLADIQLEDIPMNNTRDNYDFNIGEQPSTKGADVFDSGTTPEYPEDILGNRVKASECDAIVTALRSTRNRKEAANRLGISPRTLRYKLKKLRDYGMNVPAAYQR